MLGVEFAWVDWADTAVDWGGFDAVLIRSTWDYHRRPDEFLAWCERVDALTSLVNPASVVRWNSHKGYLVELADAGFPVVPTELVRSGLVRSGLIRSGSVPSGSEGLLDSLASRRGWDEIVLKPAVSAGARGTTRHGSGEPTTEAALAALLLEGDVLVQEYVPAVAAGELSLVFVDGDLTHSVLKVPAPGDFRVQEHHGGRHRAVQPTAEQAGLGSAVLGWLCGRGPLTYARVDLVQHGGDPLLMEVELIEPSLFLRAAPAGTAEKLVRAALAASGHGNGRW